MSKITEEKRREIIEVYSSGKSQAETAAFCGVSPTTAWKYINEAGLGPGIGGGQEKRKKITDEELREACKVMSRLEIAAKYGMHPENLSRRMQKIGCHAQKVKSDGTSVWSHHGNRGIKRAKSKTDKSWRHIPWIDAMVKEKHPGFDFVESDGKRVKIKCKTCGAIIERSKTTLRQSWVRCDGCKNNRILQEERKRLLDALLRVIEVKTPKVCVGCGKVFYSQYADQKYCDKKCRNRSKSRGANARKRCRHYGALYVPGITLRAVYERDGGICQICGKPTDWNDHSWHDSFGAFYPTIDHRVALANGGSHTWENVQLAHAICNSYKRDLEGNNGKTA